MRLIAACRLDGHVRLMARRALVPFVALGLALACAGPGPVVDHHVHEVKGASLERVAVVPFWPAPTLSKDAGPKAMGPIASADVVSRIFFEALVAAGFDTVAPSDMIIAFEGQGSVLPRQQAGPNAVLAAGELGATAVVLGQVVRYREREGGAAGALRPASVGFQVTVHTAPGGELVYTGRFDQTQQSLSANPLLARKYPGGGTRWLTAAELARWGADEVVDTLPEVLR